MGMEIIYLTDKGMGLTNSVRQTNTPEWKVINHLGRMGGKETRDKVEQLVFNGNIGLASVTIRNLKYNGIIVGG